jgi:hypothetical protein
MDILRRLHLRLLLRRSPVQTIAFINLATKDSSPPRSSCQVALTYPLLALTRHLPLATTLTALF